ncbi:MAG TPA: nitrous oxide reductase accessory protein NosL [Saprospiraceae bacterium]|nr:nitrous oxide reductase accessory protein NosL [Saprospiraceae bacterium]HMQ85629.1 nitrous oxide reductase accessory protein NosL [Saprospiraceae bacterium]
MKKLLFWPVVLLLTACLPEPQPINYGSDQCDFCRMTIVDKKHAAEVVNAKGKAYKFDAIECMIQYANIDGAEQFALYLVNDFEMPGEWLDAKTSTFLISQNIPSPMGAYLSAFATTEKAKAVQKANKGDLYNWDEIQQKIKR